MNRCTAKTFHRTRCLNLVSDDPRFCHIHSPTYKRCQATHIRNDRPCRRKPISGSAFCAHHQVRPIDPRLESASGPYAHVSGHETGRFRG